MATILCLYINININRRSLSKIYKQTKKSIDMHAYENSCNAHYGESFDFCLYRKECAA